MKHLFVATLISISQILFFGCSARGGQNVQSSVNLISLNPDSFTFEDDSRVLVEVLSRLSYKEIILLDGRQLLDLENYKFQFINCTYSSPTQKEFDNGGGGAVKIGKNLYLSVRRK